MIKKKLNKKKKSARKPVQSFTEIRKKIVKKPIELRLSQDLSKRDLERMEGEGPGTPPQKNAPSYE